MSLSFSRIWLFVVFAGAIAIAACNSESSNFSDGSGGYVPVTTDCALFSSCESCTPASGCGWCYESNGNGVCASDPNQCNGTSSTWTWSVSGCRIPATPTVTDAGAGSIDGAANARDSEANPGAADSAGPSSADANSGDASSSVTKDAGGVDAATVVDAAPTPND